MWTGPTRRQVERSRNDPGLLCRIAVSRPDVGERVKSLADRGSDREEARPVLAGDARTSRSVDRRYCDLHAWIGIGEDLQTRVTQLVPIRAFSDCFPIQEPDDNADGLIQPIANFIVIDSQHVRVVSQCTSAYSKHEAAHQLVIELNGQDPPPGRDYDRGA